MRHQIRLLIPVALFVMVHAGGPSVFPCAPDKWTQKQGASCSAIQLPSGLCNTCYLNPPHGDGKFKDCNNIYNKNQQCLAKVNLYVKHNQCDKKRVEIMNKINGGNANWYDWASLDYFLYSVCEQCCDCIPMGVTKGKDDGFWVTDRGNCPAHAYYDICQVLPNVKYFRRIGEPKNNALENAVGMCTELSKWFKSPQSSKWWSNPKTYISPALDKATVTLLNAIECSNKNIWGKCHDLEKKQNNLGNPGQFLGGGTIGATGSGKEGSIIGGGDNSGGGTDNSSPTSGTCQGQVVWTCLQGKTFGNKFCCQKPGCVCKKGPLVKPAQKGCYESGGYKKPGVGYELSNCSGNIRWGCLDAINDGSQCKWTCKKWGCRCFPFEPKASGPPNWCTRQAAKAITKEGELPASRRAYCFPDEAQVSTPYGPVEMARLRIGDHVMTRPGRFEPVYMFSHYDGGARTQMLRVSMKSGRVLSLSPGHHLLVGKEGNEMAASVLRPGHILRTVDGDDHVRAVHPVLMTGLYNPHTESGTIVVNGVLCSTYTDYLHQYTSHALLAPLRAIWQTGTKPLEVLSSMLRHGASGKVQLEIHTKSSLRPSVGDEKHVTVSNQYFCAPR